jgi:uncharacterized membrane protein
MFGLTPLGIVHTLISLVALGTGVFALARDREIRPSSRLGKTYIWTTVLTCVTGFGIFQHGGFGAPHVLGVLTLVVLGIAALDGSERLGAWWRDVVTACYTLTVFFHVVPGLTEASTRLPYGAPLFASPDDPLLQGITGAILLAFLVGIALQVRLLRGRRHVLA